MSLLGYFLAAGGVLAILYMRIARWRTERAYRRLSGWSSDKAILQI